MIFKQLQNNNRCFLAKNSKKYSTWVNNGRTTNFVARINTPAPITGYSTYDAQRKELIVNMSGGTQYIVSLNGKIILTTTQSQISIPLNTGLNKISVETDQTCLGTYQEDVLVNAEITSYPNPTTGKLTIDLNETIPQSNIEVFIQDVNGAEISRQNVQVEQGQKLNLNLTKYKNGVYLIKVGNRLVPVIKNE